MVRCSWTQGEDKVALHQRWPLRRVLLYAFFPHDIQLVGRATEAMTLLSARLGEADYFFGDKPTSLDALVFGYLEIMAQGPLHGNNTLHSTVKSCGNLFNFCSRIRKECFPQVKESKWILGKKSPHNWTHLGKGSSTLHGG